MQREKEAFVLEQKKTTVPTPAGTIVFVLLSPPHQVECIQTLYSSGGRRERRGAALVQLSATLGRATQATDHAALARKVELSHPTQSRRAIALRALHGRPSKGTARARSTAAADALPASAYKV